MKGVIFDFDGTLMDSYDLHMKCWAATLEKFNISSSELSIMQHFGKSHLDMAYALLPRIDDKLAIEIAFSEKELFKRSERDLKLFPGVLDVLSEIKRRGIRCAIASSNARAHTLEMVERFGIGHFISTITGADEVAKGKPHPALFALAAERLGIKPTETLVVGDTLHDVIAGNRAGMKTTCVVGKRMIGALRPSSLQASADYLIPEIKYLTTVLDME
ncbi:MAG: HAD family hydrolase [Nitrososphaerales archaeon]